MSLARPPAHLAPLLQVLQSPERATVLSETEWDRVLRMARSARLHGLLAHRALREDGRRLPAAVAAQLRAARAEAAYARQMLLFELDQVRRALRPIGVDMMLLKGAAYVVQGLDCAVGRLPADVDILVERAQLDRVERSLAAAGWEGSDLDEYDRRYYRHWVHQVPPLRAPGHALEVDLHHAILPPLGRMSIATAPLWEASIALAGEGGRVLGREDQVLHAVVHLFVDSDCVNRLRDLVDIAALLDQFSRDDARFASSLCARARALGVERALDHAAEFMRGWLGRDGIDGTVIVNSAAGRASRALMARRLAPPDPDRMPPCVDVVQALLVGRALWLRLPLRLAVLHAARKASRRLAS